MENKQELLDLFYEHFLILNDEEISQMFLLEILIKE